MTKAVRSQMSEKGELLQMLGQLFATAILYFFSNPKPQQYYDYTFRVAGNLLYGGIGLTEKLPPWLNEFVPFEGFYYSVFPFGSVVSMLPFALMKSLGMISDMPGAFIAAISAAVIGLFLLLIGRRYDLTVSRIVLMASGILFGTWMWTNLTFSGAWQLALGFAMIGELGAIYFSVYKKRPLIAGAFFALAFGNRTEVLLTAPIFFYLLCRPESLALAGGKKTITNTPHGNASGFAPYFKLARFCLMPFVLGVLTLIYNYTRFHSFTDFGYSRIPGVLNEPWYDHGIFSYYYIPRQAWEMLWKPWEFRNSFPFVVPNGFSSSILLSSPFLLFAFRSGAMDRRLKYSAWTAVAIMTCLLWIHGNSGGWQFGYRYAMICLPWLFVILLESSPKKISRLEWAAYIFSIAINTYATWLFHWTSYLKS